MNVRYDEARACYYVDRLLLWVNNKGMTQRKDADLNKKF